MKRTEILLAAGTLFVVITLLAGCGSPSKKAAPTTSAPSARTGHSTGGSATGSAGSTTSPSTTAALPSLAGQTFTVLGQWTGAQEAAFQRVLSSFDKETGADGTYGAAAGGDLSAVLEADLAAGSPPDMAILPRVSSLQAYAQAGALQPAGAAVRRAVEADYSSEWGPLGSYHGTLYGVPVDAADESTVWYDTGAFRRAGITSPPTTWLQFVTDANALAGAGVRIPISIGGADGWTLTDWFENVYLRTAGVADYDELTDHHIPWTDPSVTTALHDLSQIFGDQTLIGSPATAATVDFSASVHNVFKANPTSAMVYESSAVAATISSQKDPAVVGQTANFFPFPSINGSAPLVEVSADFAVDFAKAPAEQEFLQYLASPAAARLLVANTAAGFLSPDMHMPASAYPDATAARLGRQITNAAGNLVFDMSDQAPAAFGATFGAGEWAALRSFLQTGDVAATQKQLEADAAKVTWAS